MSLAPLVDFDLAVLDRMHRTNAVPLERLGVPDDIASVVTFLASPAGHWINGQTVRVNGGII
jgi:3-oxoacyl-[acyl-carrier protein] reductase